MQSDYSFQPPHDFSASTANSTPASTSNVYNPRVSWPVLIGDSASYRSRHSATPAYNRGRADTSGSQNYAPNSTLQRQNLSLYLSHQATFDATHNYSVQGSIRYPGWVTEPAGTPQVQMITAQSGFHQLPFSATSFSTNPYDPNSFPQDFGSSPAPMYSAVQRPQVSFHQGHDTGCRNPDVAPQTAHHRPVAIDPRYDGMHQLAQPQYSSFSPLHPSIIPTTSNFSGLQQPAVGQRHEHNNSLGNPHLSNL